MKGDFAKRNSIEKSITVFTIAFLLFVGTLNTASSAAADESAPEKVPAPTVSEVHEYNAPQRDEYGNVGTGAYCNERWGVCIEHGGVKIGICATNQTSPVSSNRPHVGYGQCIQYSIGGKMYVAMFILDEGLGSQNTNIEIIIGNQTIHTPLNTSDGFKLTRSPVRYDGVIPTLDLNITFERIRVYQGNHTDSTFDLTFLHHFRGNWTQTSIKVEALFDFSNATFYQPDGTEFNAGEPFTAEIRYFMQLMGPRGYVIPTGLSNGTFRYNLTLDNGSPLTVSRLDMKDSFTIYNGTGASASVGYSSMVVRGGIAFVTHGFPNLTYMDTQSMRSDPEITVYHDRVTGNMILVLVTATGVVVAVGAIGVVFIGKRKKNKQKESGKK